jgi:hypothetical protein
VLIPRAGSGWRLALIGFRSLVSGVRNVSATPDLDSFVVRECTVEMRRPHGNVAVDGELVAMRSPLTYRIDGEALRVVMPASSVSGAE